MAGGAAAVGSPRPEPLCLVEIGDHDVAGPGLGPEEVQHLGHLDVQVAGIEP